MAGKRTLYNIIKQKQKLRKTAQPAHLDFTRLSRSVWRACSHRLSLAVLGDLWMTSSFRLDAPYKAVSLAENWVARLASNFYFFLLFLFIYLSNYQQKHRIRKDDHLQARMDNKVTTKVSSLRTKISKKMERWESIRIFN